MNAALPRPPATDACEAGLRRLLDAPADAAGPRVRAVDLPSGRVWLKRAERRGFWQRLQKGAPGATFAAERHGARLLAAAGLPVVPPVAEGPDFLLLRDAGPSLERLLRPGAAGGAERRRAFAAAGRALAALHAAGVVHGRPALRDICWDGVQARFIDLERFRAPAGAAAQARDLLILAQTWFARRPAVQSELRAFYAAYRRAAGRRALDGTARLARRLAWLGWLARAAALLAPRSRELRAAPLALGWLAGLA
jgi:hypothetical protein